MISKQVNVNQLCNKPYITDEITYPFPKFNGRSVEVWESINHFILRFTGHVIYYPCWYESQSMLVKGTPGVNSFIAADAIYRYKLTCRNKHDLTSWTFSRLFPNSTVAGNWYSLFLFSSEYKLSANMRVQEPSTDMTLQYLYITFVWHHGTPSH